MLSWWPPKNGYFFDLIWAQRLIYVNPPVWWVYSSFRSLFLSLYTIWRSPENVLGLSLDLDFSQAAIFPCYSYVPRMRQY